MNTAHQEDSFYFNVPVWFVAHQSAVILDPQTGERHLISAIASDFCGGVVNDEKCIAFFTDEDLAERFSSSIGEHTAVVAVAEKEELIELLERFFSQGIPAIIIDPSKEKPWTNLKIRIPECVASIQKTLL